MYIVKTTHAKRIAGRRYQRRSGLKRGDIAHTQLVGHKFVL